MTDTDVLHQGYAWTAARIAAVPADGFDAPTPCGSWVLRDLLDHVVETMTMFADGVDTVSPDVAGDAHEVAPLGTTRWDHALAALTTRSQRAWKAPGVMARTIELPIGAMPAPTVLSASLLELVVHGWDISQASGEAAGIPDALAVPVLAFAREALTDMDHGDHFAADLGIGDTPSDQLVAFLGREPL